MKKVSFKSTKILLALIVIILFSLLGYVSLRKSHAATADINGDGTINVLDLSILATNWGKTGQTFAQGDINGDGTINVLDLSILATNWGTTVPTCTGVSVKPGDDIQSLINANPTGTTFCFAPGTYVLTGFINPKANDKLISTTRRASILTGNDTNNGGISDLTYANTGVVVQGFVIQHFKNIWGTWPRSPVSTTINWVVQDNEISYNSESGIHIGGDGTKILNNFIHHNGRYGFEGGPANNVLIDSNEVSFNNTAHNDPGNDAGGSKMIGMPGNGTFVGGQTNMNDTISNNNVHDNYGNGLWCDIDCDHFTYSGNTVTNNGGIGIFVEISWNMKIIGNTVSGNGSIWPNQLCFYGQIESGYSANVEIANNTVTAIPGTNGICASDGDRGTDPAYPSLQTGLYVHDNTVYMVANSMSGFVGREGVYSANSNNRFVNNHYHVPNLSNPYFDWKNGLNSTSVQSWSAWQAAGQDLTGNILSP